MFAIVRTGGKQYRVTGGDHITVDRVHADPGTRVDLDVLMTADGGTLGTGAVAAEIVEHYRGEKIIVFKKKRRHNYRRKQGHRQELTVLRILGFGGAGAATPTTIDTAAPMTIDAAAPTTIDLDTTTSATVNTAEADHGA